MLPSGPTLSAVATVLLAEDDIGIAQPLSRALQREGHEVVVARDGKAAAAARRLHRRYAAGLQRRMILAVKNFLDALVDGGNLAVRVVRHGILASNGGCYSVA